MIRLAVGVCALICYATKFPSCFTDSEDVSLWIRSWNSFTKPWLTMLLFLHEQHAPVLPINFLMEFTGA